MLKLSSIICFFLSVNGVILRITPNLNAPTIGNDLRVKCQIEGVTYLEMPKWKTPGNTEIEQFQSGKFRLR